MIACCSIGSRKRRDVDILHFYSECFKEGSTRRKVYDNVLRRAIRAKRMPQEAKEILAEIRMELRNYIWKTSMQKMVRLDRGFEALEQGAL